MAASLLQQQDPDTINDADSHWKNEVVLYRYKRPIISRSVACR